MAEAIKEKPVISVKDVVAKINTSPKASPTAKRLAEIMNQRNLGDLSILSEDFLCAVRPYSRSTRELLITWITEVEMDRLGMSEEAKIEIRNFDPETDLKMLERKVEKMFQDMEHGWLRGKKIT